LHRFPRATQTFAESPAAAKRLKNSDLKITSSRFLCFSEKFSDSARQHKLKYCNNEPKSSAVFSRFYSVIKKQKAAKPFQIE